MCFFTKKLLFSTGISNTWYVSDFGSDRHDCHIESRPCRNLQTVLDRATDGADIYVTSDTLSLDAVHDKVQEREGIVDTCEVKSSISYNISSEHGRRFMLACHFLKREYILRDHLS